MKTAFSLVAIGLVAGCSGGGDPKVYTPLDGTGTTPLASTVDGATLSLNRDADVLTFNGDTGQINAAGDTVTFASGATMSLTGTDNVYSRGFALSGENPAFGAFGVDTARADLPRGDASFSGETVVVATSSDGVFDLTGDANASVDFSDGSASLTLDNLSGTKATGLAAPESVDDFGDIIISDIDLDGPALTGGTTVVTTDLSDGFTAQMTGGVSGSLFGPDAEEVGGSVDLSSDDATIVGGFIASR